MNLVATSISSAYNAAAKAFTMAVINPWAYTLSEEATADIVRTVVQKATLYMVESIEQYARRNTSFGELPGNEGENALAESIKQLYQVSENLIAESIAENISKYFLFRINPARLSRGFSKIRSNMQTGAGLVMETFGNNGVPFNYSGTMGSMRPAISIIKFIEISPAWHYLQLFEKFFTQHDQDLLFILNNEVVLGRFDSFNYDQDANNPFLIEYRFQATMYPDMKFNLLDGGIANAFNAIKPELTVDQTMLDPFKSINAVSSKINTFTDTYGIEHARNLASGV